MALLKIQQTDWRQVGDTLRKDFLYNGLEGTHSEHRLEIHVDVSFSTFGRFQNAYAAILARPHFWPGTPDGFLAAQLATTDAPAEPPFILVRAGTCDDGSLILQATDREGAQAFVDVLRLGKQMRLVLCNDRIIMLELPIPNTPDAQFAFDGFLDVTAIRTPTPLRSEGGFLRRLFG